MGVYLIDHPPAISQFKSRGTTRPSGLTVVHTAESVMDTVGPDTGAENVADFIRRRTTYGSYHDLVDSDTIVQLVRYEDQAYQDGTGTNPHALSISFACRTTDWARMSPERRRSFLWQGALAFARQQAWLRARGYPMTPIRRVTKAQSDARQPGFIAHGDRDPSRRTDPGTRAPHLFPWDEFFTLCLAAVAGVTVTTDPLEEIMAWYENREQFEDFMNRAAMCRTPGDRPQGPGTWPIDRLNDTHAGVQQLLTLQGDLMRQQGASTGALVDALRPVLTDLVRDALEDAQGASADEIVDRFVARLGS